MASADEVAPNAPANGTEAVSTERRRSILERAAALMPAPQQGLGANFACVSCVSPRKLLKPSSALRLSPEPQPAKPEDPPPMEPTAAMPPKAKAAEPPPGMPPAAAQGLADEFEDEMRALQRRQQAAAAVQAATRGKQAREEVAARRARAEATASIALMLKRKNRRFGIGVRDDNCVQEVDEGSAGHEAGLRPGDWIISVAGIAVSSYADTVPLLKAIRDVPTSIVVCYVPTDHPDRVAPDGR